MNSKQQTRTMIKAFRLFLAAALLVGLALGLGPAHARDVPFPTKHTVDANFDSARDAYAADLDNDGDLDILGAAYYGIGTTYDDHISWWENDGSGGWTWHGVAAFVGAMSVYAADVDGDGDLDILGSANVADVITWWENDGTPGDGGWTEHVVDGSFDGATSVYAADLDDDGDQDILGAAYDGHDITWWENRGGQFALATTGTAPSQLVDGQTDDLLKIVMAHNGCSGDTDEELATLELLFEETASDPLTTAEANAVIANLYVYLDDGSGTFESGGDTLVATVADLALTGGVQTVILPDGDANLQVVYGTPRTYFVVVELAADAHTQTAIDQIQVTHVTESSSTAEDRTHDIPLTLEYAADTASSVVAVPRSRVWDGTGSTENWSEANNWNSDSIAPRVIDPVRFDTTSSKTAIIGTAAEAGQVTITSFGGQITPNAGLTVAGDWTQDSGTFTGGSSPLDIEGAFNLSGGTFTAPSGLMSVRSGGFAHSSGTFDPNGGRVVLDNTGDQTLSTTFNDLYLNDGLLGYWKLDEGTGTTAADSSGYGYDGTLTDGPVWSTDTPGTMDFHDPYALSFDGSDDYVDIVGTPDIDDLQQFTLAAWVELNSLPAGNAMRFITLRGEKAVLRYDNIGTAQLHFYVKINGTLYDIRVDNALSTGTWLHVAGTYDGGTMRLYLNGMEQPGAVSVSGTVDTGGGVHLSSPGGTLDGLLDDARVYSRALSATEVQALADGYDVRGQEITIGGDFVRNGGVFEAGGGTVTFDGSGTQTLDTDTIAFYDLTVNSGCTLVDAAEFTVDGTLTNNGTLQRTQEVTGTSPVNFFNTGSYGGVILNANGTDLGSTEVNIRGNQDCTTGTSGSSVKRCFDIAPANTSGLNATMRLYFSASELGSTTCGAMQVWRWNGSSWVEAGTVNSRECSTEPYYVEVTGVSSFSPFVSDNDTPGGGPTAVTLARFTARPAGGGNGFVLPLALVALGAVRGMLLWARRRG